jgi:hypothetical protein
MTITISTDPVVHTATFVHMYSKALVTNKVATVKENRANKKYERMIKKSQKKIGPYIP